MPASKFQFTAPRWQPAQQRAVYRTKLFSLLKKEMVGPEDQLTGSFYALESADWINVIPVTPEQDIVLVEQYRFGINDVTLELPGGTVDPGEDALSAAKRELAEETGFCSEHWQYLGKVSSNPAIQTNWTHTYLAADCQCRHSQQLDTHEWINVHLVAMPDFLRLAAQGVVHHSLVLAAIGKYLLATTGSQLHHR